MTNHLAYDLALQEVKDRTARRHAVRARAPDAPADRTHPAPARQRARRGRRPRLTHNESSAHHAGVEAAGARMIVCLGTGP